MYNYFPKCKLYIISYPQGGAGNLLVGVISHMLFPEKEAPVINNEMSIAHDIASIAKETHKIKDNEKQRTYTSDWNTWPMSPFRSVPNRGIPLYELMPPKDPNGYMILWDHTKIQDYNSLESVYPNFAELMITVKDEDKHQYDFTYFLKFAEMNKIGDWDKVQDEFANANPTNNWIYNFSSAYDLIKDKEHLKLFSLFYFNGIDRHLDTLGDFSEKNAIKHKDKHSKFSSKIHTIDFKTILTDMNSTLNQLSSILGVPISDNARLVYDRWINKQVLLESILDK